MRIDRGVAIIVILGLIGVSCQNKNAANGGSQAPAGVSSLGAGTGEWVIKIDSLTVYEDTFTKDLSAFMKLNGQTDEQIALAKNDSQTKQAYSEKVINDVLLLKKADSDKFFESEEAISIIDAALRNIKVQYYTQKLMADASQNIPDPTEEQARAFFEQAGGQISQYYGISEFTTETRPAINQLYKIAYAEQIVQRDISDLKDKSIIERNETILGRPSLLPPAGGFGTQQGQTQPILPRATN